MKLWPLFVLGTIFCWGAYVPMIHNGQLGFAPRNSALRAFIFVGAAYFIMALVTFGYIVATKAEPLEFKPRGVSLSLLAGTLGALGALGIVFAMAAGGKPIYVAPIVFAGAPIVNTIVTMIWHKPANPPHVLFFVGIGVAAVGASMVLYFKPT